MAYLAYLSMHMHYIIDFVVFWAYIGVIMLVIAKRLQVCFKKFPMYPGNKQRPVETGARRHTTCSWPVRPARAR